MVKFVLAAVSSCMLIGAQSAGDTDNFCAAPPVKHDPAVTVKLIKPAITTLPCGCGVVVVVKAHNVTQIHINIHNNVHNHVHNNIHNKGNKS